MHSPIFVLALAFALLPSAGWAGPAKLTIPHSWLDSCPKPFKGSDDPIAKDLNSTWVSKVGAEGAAPNAKLQKAILSAATKAVDSGQLSADLGKPALAALRTAHASNKVTRDGRVLAIENQGCSFGLRQWKELAVIWMKEPCEPAVLLFHQDKSGWKFACITEFIFSEQEP